MSNKPQINQTVKVVREAMRIVSKDVRAPKVVRDGHVTLQSQPTKGEGKR
jgi:hypothetical protein